MGVENRFFLEGTYQFRFHSIEQQKSNSWLLFFRGSIQQRIEEFVEFLPRFSSSSSRRRTISLATKRLSEFHQRYFAISLEFYFLLHFLLQLRFSSGIIWTKKQRGIVFLEPVSKNSSQDTIFCVMIASSSSSSYSLFLVCLYYITDRIKNNCFHCLKFLKERYVSNLCGNNRNEQKIYIRNNMQIDVEVSLYLTSYPRHRGAKVSRPWWRKG